MDTPHWKERQKRVVVSAVLSLSVMIVPAQGEGGSADSWKNWQAKGDVLMAESEVTEACNAFRRALIEALRAHSGAADLLRIHTALASAYSLNGRFAEAETEFRRTLGLEQSIRGTESLDYAMDMAGLFLLPTHSGDREQAIQLLKRAIARHAQSANVPELVMAKDYLAKLLFNEGRVSEADDVLLEAQTNSLAPPADPGVWLKAELLNDLGVVRDREGRFQEAAELSQQTVQLIEKKFGRESSLLVAPLNNLATMYVRIGKFAEAEAVYARAADVCEKTRGMDHPVYGELLKNRAFVLKHLGRKKESREMLAKSERIVEESNRRNGIGATVSLAALRAER